MSDTLSVCGLTICRGSKLRTMLPVPGTEIEIPLTIINGAFDGPTLLVTAGIHGGEYPGIAAAMELGRSLDPQEIHGSLIMLHPVNIQGFWARREFIVPEDGKKLKPRVSRQSRRYFIRKNRRFNQQQLLPSGRFLC